jgi:hypothetical protein
MRMRATKYFAVILSAYIIDLIAFFSAIEVGINISYAAIIAFIVGNLVAVFAFRVIFKLELKHNIYVGFDIVLTLLLNIVLLSLSIYIIAYLYENLHLNLLLSKLFANFVTFIINAFYRKSMLIKFI